jgi:hypothetical protein
MDSIIKTDFPDPTNNAEGFDYRQPIFCELSAGLQEGEERPVTSRQPGLNGDPDVVFKADLVVSFEATDWARVLIESTADDIVKLGVNPEAITWAEVETVDLAAACRELRRYTLPAGTTGLRFTVKARRACKRVDIYSQAKR